MTDPILSVRDLHVSFPSEAGLVEAVNELARAGLTPKRGTSCRFCCCNCNARA